MRNIMLGILCSMLFFVSCYKDISEFIPYEEEKSPNVIIGTDLIRNLPTAPVDTFKQIVKYDSLNGISEKFKTKRGTIITLNGPKCFYTGCFSANNSSLANCSGSPCRNNDELILEVIEIWKKGDMIRYARPTLNDDEPLESGSELLILLRRKKTGEIVQLQKGYSASISIPKIKEAKLINSMFSFRGVFSKSDSSFTWKYDTIQNETVPAPLTTWKTDSMKTVLGWVLQVKTLNWINCDAAILNSTSSQYNTLTAKLPAPYTNKNTVCWLVFDNYNSALSANISSTAGHFIFNKIPNNEPVTLITISKENDKYYFGTAKMLSSNLTPQSIDITPSEKTLKEINDFLDKL
jgi:hypothetical protein